MYELSKSGQFTIEGSKLTALQCAEKANLYEAFNFLAHEKALNRLMNEPQKQ